MNYRSFESEEVVLPTTPGLKMMTGDNQVDVRLGANGAGKTSLWDAVCFCTYGSPIKGGRISSVLTWGEERVDVTCDWDINGEIFSIHRFGPPSRIEINGQPSTQENIEQILRLSKSRFLHSVIFGQGIRLFPDLPITERADLFDEVLGLSVWGDAVELAASKHKDFEAEKVVKCLDIKFIEGKLSGLPDEDLIKEKIATWDQQRIAMLSTAAAQCAEWELSQSIKISEATEKAADWAFNQEQVLEKIGIDLEELEEEQKEIQEKIEKSKQIQVPNSLKELDTCRRRINEKKKSYYNLKSVYDNLITRINFLGKSSVCPTCDQSISDDVRDKQLENLNNLKEELNLKIVTNEKDLYWLSLDEEILIAENDKAAQKIVELNTELNTLSRQETWLSKQIIKKEDEAQEIIKKIDTDLNPFVVQASQLEKEENPYKTNIVQIRGKQNPYMNDLVQTEAERQMLTEQLQIEKGLCNKIEENILAAEYWKHGFKRIRLYFVQRVLQALEVEISVELVALGLVGWKVGLTTETENKSGNLKLGIQIVVSSPTATASWDEWSGGESQRLRLAMAKGFASLIQRAAGIIFDFEVLDEPTNWLSEQGIEDLLEVLRSRAENENKQVWLIDHRALQSSGFSEIWCVRKDSTGSHVEQIM